MSILRETLQHFLEDSGLSDLRTSAAMEIIDLLIQQERIKAQEEVVNGLTLDLIVIAKSIPPEQVVSEIAIKLKELKQSLAEGEK